MIKIRKLISSCAVGCSCLWFPVSAFADLTLQDILNKIVATYKVSGRLPGEDITYKTELTCEDLENIGVLEEATRLFHEANEWANHKLSTMPDLGLEYATIQMASILKQAEEMAMDSIYKAYDKGHIAFLQRELDKKTAQVNARKKNSP
jgi:hypothetical protein